MTTLSPLELLMSASRGDITHSGIFQTKAGPMQLRDLHFDHGKYVALEPEVYGATNLQSTIDYVKTLPKYNGSLPNGRVFQSSRPTQLPDGPVVYAVESAVPKIMAKYHGTQ